MSNINVQVGSSSSSGRKFNQKINLNHKHHNQKQTLKIGSDLMEIIPLGAGREVGRSAVVVSFKGKSVLFDCGIHPGKTGIASLPYFDQYDTKKIDLVLVTHFHLDHCGAVPHFLEKTEFKGKIYMTHPTKAIYRLLLNDFLKMSDSSEGNILYTSQDLAKSLQKIELIDYHQELSYKGIKFWCYNAGHVLGAAMFMIEIAGIRVLYTGDFSRESDRHLLGAETPSVKPDVLIVESTYGINVHMPRKDKEARFTKMVHSIVRRGGRCLLPVFALGRAQELLLILDEYWESHPELKSIPIYYASSLALKSIPVFQTYINMMNEKVQKQFEISNPFIFKNIINLKGINDFSDDGPCVVMASPGMLQSGISKQLFEMWCQDKKNGVIIPGYSVEGTLAKTLLSEPEYVPLSSGYKVPRRITVEAISFSAHSDREQTEEFIDSIKPKHIVLVHGELTNMTRLRDALLDKFKDKYDVQIYTPDNCKKVRINFYSEKVAKVLGSLAKTDLKRMQSEEKTETTGVLLHKDFQYLFVSPDELLTYSDIPTTSVQQKLVLPLPSIKDEDMDKLSSMNINKILKQNSKIQSIKSEIKSTKNMSLNSEDMELEDIKTEEKEESSSVETNVKLIETNEDEEMLDSEESNKLFNVAKYWSYRFSRIFQNIKVIKSSKKDKQLAIIKIGNVEMIIEEDKENEATLQWTTNSTNDVVCDAICIYILDSDKFELFPEKLNLNSLKHSKEIREKLIGMLKVEDHDVQSQSRILYILYCLLKEQFKDESIEMDVENRSIKVNVDGLDVNVDSKGKVTFDVEKINESDSTYLNSLITRLQMIVRRIMISLIPMPSMMGCLDH